MPFINVHIGKPISEDKKEEVMKAIASHMTIIPGKTIDNTMIEISAGRDMFMGGEKRDLIYVDMKVNGPAPTESKDEFVKALVADFEKILDIPGKNFYMSIAEMTGWGVGAGYKGK